MRSLLPWILAALVGLIAVEAFVIVERRQARREWSKPNPACLPTVGSPTLDVAQEGWKVRIWLRNTTNRPLKYLRCDSSSNPSNMQYLKGDRWFDVPTRYRTSKWQLLEPGEMAQLSSSWSRDDEWARVCIPCIQLGPGGWNYSAIESVATEPFRATRDRERFEWSERGRKWVRDGPLVGHVRRIAIALLPSTSIGHAPWWMSVPCEGRSLIPEVRITAFDGYEMRYEVRNATPFEFEIDPPELWLGQPTVFEKVGEDWRFADTFESRCVSGDAPFLPGETLADDYSVMPRVPDLKLQVVMHRELPGEPRSVWWLTLETRLGDDLPEWDVRSATDAAYLGWRLVQARPDYMR